MAIDKETILFSIDGVLVQCKLAHDLADEKLQPAVDSITAAVQTLRALFEATHTPSDASGKCSHPLQAVRWQHAPGGVVIGICGLCNEMLEKQD